MFLQYHGSIAMVLVAIPAILLGGAARGRLRQIRYPGACLLGYP